MLAIFFSSDQQECEKQGRRQLAYHFLPLALWQGEEREGELVPSAFGNLQETRGAIEMMERETS